ncbi:MAG TPA: YggS family pyridoxal phosphate-dependent enzyme [Actinomycetota bacterium]|nr:YggS family pyridoxal phosphate-dependent enzyme [Actinomycetota bacterium]
MSERSKRTVLDNLAAIREGVANASTRVGRDPDTVTIVAAGKTVEPEALRWVVEAGVPHLGENYLQELRAKRDHVAGATWHFIGTLQRGTAHHVAELVDVLETAVPGRALVRLARRAAATGRSVPALVEVDFTGERSGVPPDGVLEACDEVARTDGLRLVGLMTLPPLTPDAERARPYFVMLRELRERVRERHPGASELSMGMSLDYEVAVEEGATMVRIGTALFGERPPR